jgi:prepilin-type N-terminal cleavage/methylation domain-containing protein
LRIQEPGDGIYGVGRNRQSQRGFSLVELLLTLVLILCLAAASVFTFTAVYRTANLDEGSDRFQSLIRFAQAEAATTGRKVRLEFQPTQLETASETAEELREIKVTWEADMLNSPGVFEVYTNKAWSEEIVNELVVVEKVAPLTESGEPMPTDTVAADIDPMDPMPTSEEFPSITFYPDGTSDSAEVVLASRNDEDERRLAVRLGGMLGTVSTRTLSASEVETGERDADSEFEEEFNEVFESSTPVSQPDSYSDFTSSGTYATGSAP